MSYCSVWPCFVYSRLLTGQGYRLVSRVSSVSFCQIKFEYIHKEGETGPQHVLKECMRLFIYNFYMFFKHVFCEKEIIVLTKLSLTYLNYHVVDERGMRPTQ